LQNFLNKGAAMKTLHFKSYKISSKLPLENIGALFNFKPSIKRKDYIVLNEHQLELIFKYTSSSKTVYIFQYGCICFANFAEDEIYVFLQHIDSISCKVNFHLFSKYNDSHTITIDESGMCKLWKSCEESISYSNYYTHIICIILAKSTELYKLENDVNDLLDKAERFLNRLHLGKLHLNKKGFAVTATKVLRLEYHIINNIKIFERYAYSNESLESRDIYDRISYYYELDGRCRVVQHKIDNLRGIHKSYSSLSYSQYEARLFLLEIFMLAVFPFFYIIHLFPIIHIITRFLQFIFN
jgi:required for meiotic nuclear division protein 1